MQVWGQCLSLASAGSLRGVSRTAAELSVPASWWVSPAEPPRSVLPGSVAESAAGDGG